MKALILAAGLGTRLKPYTDTCPKPLIPLLNIPMIGYPLHLLEQIGVTDITVNLHHLPEVMKSELPKLLKPDMGLTWSDESDQILDSGGALSKVKDQFDDHFWVANADSFVVGPQRPLEAIYKAHKAQDRLVTLIGLPMFGAGQGRSALWVGPEKGLAAVGTDLDIPGTTPLQYPGLMVLSPRIFDFVPDGPSRLFQDILIPAIESGEKVFVESLSSFSWMESGNPDDYFKATGWGMNQLIVGGAFHPQLVALLNRFAPMSRFGKLGDLIPGTPSPNTFCLIDQFKELDLQANISQYLVLGSGARISLKQDVERLVLGSETIWTDRPEVSQQNLLVL